MSALATSLWVNWSLYRVVWIKNIVEMWLFLDWWKCYSWNISSMTCILQKHWPLIVLECCFSKVLKSLSLHQPVLSLICTYWFAGTLAVKKDCKRRKVIEDHRRVKKRKVKAQSASRQVLTTENLDVCLLDSPIAYRMSTHRAFRHGDDVWNILVLSTF